MKDNESSSVNYLKIIISKSLVFSQGSALCVWQFTIYKKTATKVWPKQTGLALGLNYCLAAFYAALQPQ